MPLTLGREEVARDIFLLTDRDFHTVATLVEELLDDEPPLSAEELQEVIEAEEDIARGHFIPWEEAKRELEALP